jgi:hypothetical protein
MEKIINFPNENFYFAFNIKLLIILMTNSSMQMYQLRQICGIIPVNAAATAGNTISLRHFPSKRLKQQRYFLCRNLVN